jgi:membrane protein
MTFRNAKKLVVQTVLEWIDDDVPALGAALAYYTLFSLSPLLVIVIAVAGIVFGRDAAEGRVFNELSGLMGNQTAATIQELLRSVGSKGAGWFAVITGVLMMLFVSTTAFAMLQTALDRIWRAPPPPESGSVLRWLRVRLLSFGMVLGFGFLLLASLLLSAAMSAIGAFWTGAPSGIYSLIELSRFPATLAIITLVFALIYKYLPRVHVAWRDVWLGAVVTALLFVLGEMLIGMYLGRTGFGSAFGAAGSVFALLMWLYYSAQVFLLGAKFTSVYARSRGSLAGLPDSHQPQNEQRT